MPIGLYWDSQPHGRNGRAKVLLGGTTIAIAQTESGGERIAEALNTHRHVAPLRRSLERIYQDALDSAANPHASVLFSRQRLAAMKKLITQAGGQV